MNIQIYSGVTSFTFILTRFLTGEIYQIEVGTLVFIQLFLFLYNTLGFTKRWFFISLYITIFTTLCSLTVVSKYNEMISTIKIEQNFVVEETTRHMLLLKDRMILQTRSNNLQNQEQMIHNLIGLVSSSFRWDSPINIQSHIEQVVSIFPKAERRLIDTFQRNVEALFQQSMEEIQLKKDQLLSPDVLYDHLLGNMMILNKYFYLFDLLNGLCILNLMILPLVDKAMYLWKTEQGIYLTTTLLN